MSENLSGKRILVFHPHPDLYGADQVLVRVLEMFRDAGTEVRVVVPDQGPLLDVFETMAIDFRVVDFLVLRKEFLRPKGLLRLIRRVPQDSIRLRREVDEFKPDLVFANTITVPLPLLIARLRRIRTICHVHELEDQLPAVLSRLLTLPLLLADRLIANSQATLRWMCRDWPRLANRTEVIYNSLNFADLKPGIDRPIEGRPASIAIVGRLSPRKGQDVAIDAIAKLVAEGYDVTLSLAGSVFPGYEWFEQSLRDRACELNIADRVAFLGFQERPWETLNSADVILVPSLLEPFGLVAAEALACERPTIVSNVGGLPEIVRNGETGLVVRSGNVDELKNAIKTVLSDFANAKRCAVAGGVDIRAKFSEASMRDTLVEVVRANSSRPINQAID